MYLMRGRPGSGAYLRASFGYDDQRHGLSDVDLLVALGPSGAHACPPVRRRWTRLCRVLPGLGELVQPTVYQEEELREAVSSTTLISEGAIHLSPEPQCDPAGLRLRPGLFGPMSDWRHLTGTDRRPTPLPGQTDHERRTAAWLELQRWWREAYYACAHPGGPRLPYLCVKLVAEPARVYLWLVHGEKVTGRRETLERALAHLPEERDAILQATRLYDELHRSPDPPLADMLAAFVRLTARIGRRLTSEVEPAGTTSVALEGGGELILGPDAREPLRALGLGEPRLLPLCDWRARAWPTQPDEALALLDVDPTDPASLGAAALAAGDWGPYAAIRRDDLLILPGPGLLRAVQCPVTDPVSFAVIDGGREAEFPNVAGWSARDSARRAVAEHAAWLGVGSRSVEALFEAQARTTAPDFQVLGRLLAAARAALFAESLERGQPRLLLTLAAAATELGPPASDGFECLREARLGHGKIATSAVLALREAVLELPAYADRGAAQGALA